MNPREKASTDGTRVPVIIATGDYISGVTTWAFRLRQAFADHLKYQILVMNCRETRNEIGYFDLTATTKQAVHDTLERLSPAIVIPNSTFDIIPICADLNKSGRELRVIGFCRSDSEEQYYNALVWYDPMLTTLAAVSHECASELERRIPSRTMQIHTLPTSVEVPQGLKRDYARRPIRLIYAGRIVQKQKRVMDFVPLVKELLRREVDFTFDIYGRGRAAEELQQALGQVARVPHHRRVQIMKTVRPDQMGEIWSKHEVFIQTSDFEGMSNSMLESMAHGNVPIVTAVRSGVSGIIQPGLNGFVVPVGNMLEVAGIIENLVTQPGLLEQIGQTAYESAKEFSIERYSEKFVKMLDETLEAPIRSWPAGFERVPKTKIFGQELRGEIQTLSRFYKSIRRLYRRGGNASGRRRLLVAFPSPIRGGAEDYALTIAAAARSEGWTVHAGFPARPGTESLIKDFEACGAQYHPIEICDVGQPKEINPIPQCVSEMTRLLHELKPDVVLLELCGVQYGLGPIVACAITETPLLVVFQMVKEGVSITPGHRNWFRMARMVRRQRYVAVSEFNRGLIAQYFNLPREQISLIPNGARIEPIRLTGRDQIALRQRVREELRIPPGWMVALTVGRLVAQKGHDILIQAIPNVLNKHPKTSFVWAGEGPLRRELEELIAECGIKENVHLLGRRKDIPELLKAVDLFVHPTRFEGQPFSLLEAMSSGLPIVSTNASGIPEIIDQKKHGLLCRAEDIADLSQAVLYALDRPEEMRKMAEEARRRVETFSEERMIEQTLRLLSEHALVT